MHKAPNDHPNADDDEGNAEPLAHVEGHALLKFHLDILQKLDADARAEDDDKEGPKHQAGLFVTEVTLVVHPQQDAHCHKTEESLVESRRMTGQPLAWRTTIARSARHVIVDSAAELLRASHEDKAPWQRGGRAVNLVVGHIATTNQSANETDGDDDTVKDPDVIDALGAVLRFLRRLVVATHIEPQAQQNADGTAMAGQTAFPHGEHLQRMGKIIFRLIKQAMPQSCANDGEQQHKNQQFVQRFVRHLLATVDLTHDEIAQQKAQSPHEAVPTHVDVADGKQDGIDVPGDVV